MNLTDPLTVGEARLCALAVELVRAARNASLDMRPGPLEAACQRAAGLPHDTIAALLTAVLHVAGEVAVIDADDVAGRLAFISDTLAVLTAPPAQPEGIAP